MYELHITGYDKPLKVARFQGVEVMNDLFRFDVVAVIEDEAVDLRGFVGRDAVLHLGAIAGSRTVPGIVRKARQGRSGGLATAYEITLVPPHYRLKLQQDHRVFQKRTVPEIVQQISDEAGLAIRLALHGHYEPREYCVQYRESDWDFICRLLEDEGIAAYFEPSDETCQWVLADAPAAFAPIEGDSALLFRPPAGAIVGGDHVSDFRVAEDMRPGKVTVRDYNFQKPLLRVEGAHKGRLDDEIEVYDYPADEGTPEAAKGRAQVRQAGQESQRSTVLATSNAWRLAPGLTFKLSEHPREGFNAEYLVTRAYSTGHDPQMIGGFDEPVYAVEIDGLPAKTRYVPPLVTPRPRIMGIQTAIVVGPAGEEIYVDEHGRVKVQFHWDREGKKDESSSCWIRVAQTSAGPAFGAVVLPRIGHEVVVSFVDGDPDRPLVTGSVYHGANVPPYALPGDRTRTTFKTRSSPGGEGYNELRFEDRKGAEEVFLRAERDMSVEVRRSRSEHIGKDETISIDEDRSLTIGRNDAEKVGVDRMVEIGANHTEIVGANLSLSVGGNIAITGTGGMSFALGGSLEARVDGEVKSAIGKKKEEEIALSSVERVGGDKTTKVAGTLSFSADKDAKLAVQGNEDEDIGGKKTVQVGETYTLECGDAKIVVQKNGDIAIQGKSVKIVMSGPVQVEGSKLQVKTDGAVDVNAGGNVKVKGGTVDLN